MNWFTINTYQYIIVSNYSFFFISKTFNGYLILHIFHNLMQMTAKTESVQCGPTEREDITFDFYSFLLHMVVPRLMRIVIILKILLTSCGSY